MQSPASVFSLRRALPYGEPSDQKIGSHAQAQRRGNGLGVASLHRLANLLEICEAMQAQAFSIQLKTTICVHGMKK